MTTAAAVDQIVALGGPPLGRLMAELEQRLVATVDRWGDPLAGHGTATIAAGGKRLRPLLVFLAAGVPPPEAPGLVRAAVAVELLHSATLVHDDVLDGAALRRGRPTVVASAGAGVATATGDLLFSRAFGELARNASAPQVRVLSDASSALARGELLQRADAFDAGVPVERYLERCELKTASLFEAACRLGALAAPSPRSTPDALGAFGRRIGLAFQLLDDVLDVAGPTERIGKQRGTDLLDGTVTLPLILARERDADVAGVDLRGVTGAEEAEALCDRIAATGALDLARGRALAIVTEAKATLPALPPRQAEALDRVADGVVERYA